MFFLQDLKRVPMEVAGTGCEHRAMPSSRDRSLLSTSIFTRPMAPQPLPSLCIAPFASPWGRVAAARPFLLCLRAVGVADPRFWKTGRSRVQIPRHRPPYPIALDAFSKASCMPDHLQGRTSLWSHMLLQLDFEKSLLS